MFDNNLFERRLAKVEVALRRKFRQSEGDLEDLMRHAGRRLPRAAHEAAQGLVQTRLQAGHPKLAPQIDAGRVDRQFRTVEAAIAAHDPAEARKRRWIGAGASLAFNLLLFFGLVMGFALWRGWI
ncbi:hypothetical protein [Pseudooceanicola aestuarii]|uniref:hypothetical protein n=1 Tax=Pseudooceanicola aestuarii TaxID=2697319 RepID=UPI0013D740CD|nr:hypothetical protein [Pseudooceanicola aestuarii]